MEKIYKLLKSNNEGDNEIGLQLLIYRPIEEILEIFRDLTIDKGSEVRGYLDVNTRNKHIQGYIRVNDDYVIMVHIGLRLRKISSSGFNRQEIIISKENFINGVY